MKKFIGYFIGIFILCTALYFAFVYSASYSTGVRSGHLIKFSYKGVIFKTWEGELSQGLSGSQIFSFSVLDQDKEVINQLQNLEGQYVKLKYKERYKTFPWWGDTNYFVTEIRKEQSPYNLQ
ncbi:6-phosphogluconate dehydrogenase [Flavobacterium sp.]|uniref:6-phosphogluconate dehydrogenase n=1 Tax=Flavobacterium sp. TaxID=239 RepID=UPI003C60C7D3